LQNIGFRGLDLCTKATSRSGNTGLLHGNKTKTAACCKSLILLDFFSCPFGGQLAGRLDFQGFQRIPTEFSTKLSTEIMGQAQSAEKSMTYLLFQEVD
jgi:hypothetical protein